MAVELAHNVRPSRFPRLAWLRSRQAFWVFVAVCVACLLLSFATLGMLSIARSLAMVASNNTVVFQFEPDHDKLLYLGGGALLFGIANRVIYMLVLAGLTGFVLHLTCFGRYIFAIAATSMPRWSPACRRAASRSRST